MPDLLPLLLFLLCVVAGLALVPLGLPGLWVIVLGVLVYGWLTDFRTVGVGLIGLSLALAFAGELIEAWVGFKFAKRYGASGRAGWGAIAGGIVGAVIGVPVPIVGSVIGAFVGAFAGAALFEYLSSWRAGTAIGAGWGAVLGRAAGTAAKIGIGVVIGVATLIAIFRT